MNRHHRFWRVLALEEFTDVQCVIVDHPMPSLAGDRGSSKDHRPSNRFLSVTPSGFSEIFINQCHSRFHLEIYRGSTTKDVIWFSSRPYDSRNGYNIMEIALSRHGRFACFDFVNQIIPQDSCRAALRGERRSIMDITRRHGSLVRISRACPTPAQ